MVAVGWNALYLVSANPVGGGRCSHGPVGRRVSTSMLMGNRRPPAIPANLDVAQRRGYNGKDIAKRGDPAKRVPAVNRHHHGVLVSRTLSNLIVPVAEYPWLV